MKQLFELRMKAIADMRAMLDKAKAENRGLNPGERETSAKLDAAIDGYTDDIALAEKQERRDRELSRPNAPRVGLTGHAGADGDGSEVEERAVAFDKWLRFGADALNDVERRILNPQRDTRARASVIDICVRPPYHAPAFRTPEFRTAQSGVTGAAGAYLIPTGFSATLERSMLDFGGMRQASTVLPTDSGNDLPYPTVDDTSNTGELLAENTAAAQKEVVFGQIIFKAYKYSSKEVLVPQELLEDSGVDVEALIGSLLGERIGRITNTHFTTGDNAGKPQGAVTASSAGKTAASATAITVGELLDLFHSVDPAYRVGPKVAWMFKDSTFAAIRKLTLADWAGAQAVWQPGLAAGAPGTILGKPYFINQDMAAITNSAKTVLFGDFSKYVIRDVAAFRLRRLVERYAEKDQVSFIAFSRHDGRVLDAGTDPIKHLIQLA